MVGASHEASHRIFQKDPGLLTHALQRALGVPFPETREIAAMKSLAAALKTIDRDSAAVFVQFVDSCLVDSRAKQMWRDLMTAIQYFWRHPLAEQVREEGREEGREQGRIQQCAEMVLRVLEWRGIPVSDLVSGTGGRLHRDGAAGDLGPARGARHRCRGAVRRGVIAGRGGPGR
ncbi:hypothetical protein [Streptomyces sp. NPDC008092]|uniref:hypothetical protein n=1 Tax=Streptomyces sp. NPDC008092 TaxID=3364808 RepID=UPI0036F09D83